MPVRDLWRVALDLLFPPRCVSCQQHDTWLCQRCIDRSPRVEPPFCPRCGGPPDGPGYRLCPRCRAAPPTIQRTRSVFYFEGPLRTAIHRLKYDGVTALAHPLGSLLAEYWLTHPMSGAIIVPVPLHRRRHRARGFNQAALLARQLSQQVTIPLDERTLVRHRATASQVGLDADERLGNVRDAFQCTSDELAGAHVVLVDDVRTSGATLEACGTALRRGGAVRVDTFTLARARW